MKSVAVGFKMKELSPEEGYKYFLGLFDEYNGMKKNLNKEDFEDYILSDFDVNLFTFFHLNNLMFLLDHGYINNEIKELATSIRGKYYKQYERSKYPLHIGPEFKEAMQLYERLAGLVKEFEQTKKQ